MLIGQDTIFGRWSLRLALLQGDEGAVAVNPESGGAGSRYRWLAGQQKERFAQSQIVGFIGSSGRTRTYNPSVNSRMLCH